ncbi:PREDICTED: ras-like GTP-binding protein RYL1 [Branchiostoma belcheri]|uniref:Ras-like GTP-binding protein RYL1 n=1 Tax=Branchiostoma belcheri TaxID=7741 RepID=A0A6P4ZW50_BRABE|nr:PREDICTED: ras-like GTP-binding protein RYL1 [Branchiostoma belcheri]
MSQNRPVSRFYRNLTTPIKKVVLLGDAGVGKSSLFARFCGEDFLTSVPTTVQPRASDIREFQVGYNNVRISLWDTAGVERMLSLTENYYRKAVGVLLVYDVMDRETFDNLEHTWVPSVTLRNNRVKAFLVGNKSDLTTDSAEVVSEEEVKTYSRTCPLDVVGTFRVSAKTCAGVEDMFAKLAESVLEDYSFDEVKGINLAEPNSQQDVQTSGQGTCACKI